ncbi:hypothetical protein HDU99_006359, partial [Rhizoclosmatium hyalinum]
YEKEIKKLCESWTQDDTHLHLAYISHRSLSTRPETFMDTVRSLYTPQLTDWYIFINENVAILPCDLYGRHREDGSGWTVATMGDAEVRALPAYIPAWDATPAPEYCPDTSISIPLQEKQ